MIFDSAGILKAKGHLEGKAAWLLIEELTPIGGTAYVGGRTPWKIRRRRYRKEYKATPSMPMLAVDGKVRVVKRALAEGSYWLLDHD